MEQQPDSLEKSVSAIISTLQLFNLQPPAKTATLCAKLLQSTAVYMITQSLAIMLFGWKQWTFASRVAAMENLTYSFGFFSISTDLFLMANRTSDLITMIRSNYYVFDIEHCKGYSVRERKMQLIKTMDTATVKGVVMIEKILRCLFVGYMTLPAVSIVFYYFQLSKIEDLRLPFIIFVPKLYPITLTFSTIHQYLFATGLNIVYLFYSAVITITVFKIMLLSVNNVRSNYYVFDIEHCKGYSVRERKMQLIKTMDTATVKGVVMIEKILRCLFVGYMTLPAVSIVFYYFQLSKIEDLRLPFIIFVPKLYPITLTFSTIHQYLFATGLNIVYLFYSAVITITVFKIMLLSVNNVLTEMKLFHLNFEEIDLLLEAERERGFEEMETGERIDRGLKRIMRHVVEHHKVIFRKVGILNSGLKFRLFYFNTFSCLQICLSIFSFMKGELTFKIKHGIVIFGVVMNCFFICDLGQKLQDEGEKIRNNLIYGCNWLNKPNWMNKALLFMMIQNNKLPKLGLFNVFTLNRNNLRVIVQGAYSYFNLLKNISN